MLGITAVLMYGPLFLFSLRLDFPIISNLALDAKLPKYPPPPTDEIERAKLVSQRWTGWEWDGAEIKFCMRARERGGENLVVGGDEGSEK